MSKTVRKSNRRTRASLAMDGGPPRSLDDEIQAMKRAEKRKRGRSQPIGSPAIKPGSYMDYLSQHPEEVNRILRRHGLELEEINRILEQGGGRMPVGYGQKNQRRQTSP
jgi:hypothetical protein